MIEQLVRLPKGPFYTLLWVEKIGPRKKWWKASTPGERQERLKKLRSAITYTCTRPGSDWWTEAQDYLTMEREEDAAADKRRHLAPARTAPRDTGKLAPKRVSHEIPERFVNPWAALLRAVDDPTRDTCFADAWPVELREGVFVIAVERAAIRDRLNHRVLPAAVSRIRAGTAAEAANPTYPDVEALVARRDVNGEQPGPADA